MRNTFLVHLRYLRVPYETTLDPITLIKKSLEAMTIIMYVVPLIICMYAWAQGADAYVPHHARLMQPPAHRDLNGQGTGVSTISTKPHLK